MYHTLLYSHKTYIPLAYDNIWWYCTIVKINACLPGLIGLLSSSLSCAGTKLVLKTGDVNTSFIISERSYTQASAGRRPRQRTGTHLVLWTRPFFHVYACAHWKREGEGKGRKNGMAKLARFLKSLGMLMTWEKNFSRTAKWVERIA